MKGETAFDEADLHGLVDGRIEPARAAALAASLGSDPAASARVDAWRSQTESLRAMFTSVLCEPVPVRLLPIAVADARGRPAGRSAAGPDPRPVGGAMATTAIGAALVGFALGALASVGTDNFGIASSAPRDPGVGDAGTGAGDDRRGLRDLAARAAEAHRTFLASPWPAEAAGDPAAAAAVPPGAPRPARPPASRPGAGPRAPDLTREGWTFVGSRVVPGRRGPAILLTYADGADSLGLLVSRDGADRGSAAPRVVSADDEAGPLGVATWTEGASAYALTSARGRDWLARHLSPLRDAVKARMRPLEGLAPAP